MGLMVFYMDWLHVGGAATIMSNKTNFFLWSWILLPSHLMASTCSWVNANGKNILMQKKSWHVLRQLPKAYLLQRTMRSIMPCF